MIFDKYIIMKILYYNENQDIFNMQKLNNDGRIISKEVSFTKCRNSYLSK